MTIKEAKQKQIAEQIKKSDPRAVVYFVDGCINIGFHDSKRNLPKNYIKL